MFLTFEFLFFFLVAGFHFSVGELSEDVLLLDFRVVRPDISTRFSGSER